MRLKRCAHLAVTLDTQPRFAFAALLSGGDGLDRRPRWLAHAPHLPDPVTVDLAMLALLEALDDDWRPRAELEAQFAPALVARLVATGLLLDDGPDSARDRDADQATRDIAWWPPALMAQAQGAWAGVDIEQRGATDARPSVRELVETFGEAPSPEFRRSPDRPALSLAAPRRTDFDALLSSRRTCRNFDPDAALGAEAFATMMRRVWGALGTHELAPGAVVVKKTSPAGGGMHAVEAYVLVQRVEGIAPGFYHYLPMRHALEPLQSLAPAEAADWAHRFVAGQAWFRDVPVMVARFDRMFWKYRRHAKAWRVVHLDVGHLSQTMYLSATELGLGCFVTAAINDRDVGEALALPALREGAIALVGFGPRSAQRRHAELDQFEPVVLAGPPTPGPASG
ncbi:MAG TPA: putative peptide maturation dehydrogenase [Arenimonas sp.]|nr:putative peptide maturation dehydrogenase [Arenimonas sp.]